MPAVACAGSCSLVFNSTPAALTLPVTSTALHRILVGTVIQSCRNTSASTLVIASVNCPFPPVGAKLMELVSWSYVPYSVESDNKAVGGGVAIVNELLSQACAAQVARKEKSVKGSLSSDIYVNFTGVATLSEGTYSDTLSVTLNIN